LRRRGNPYKRERGSVTQTLSTKSNVVRPDTTSRPNAPFQLKTSFASETQFSGAGGLWTYVVQRPTCWDCCS
jgi:hypothetical protein